MNNLIKIKIWENFKNKSGKSLCITHNPENKTDKSDCIQLKHFCIAKTTASKIKSQTKTGKNCFQFI